MNWFLITKGDLIDQERKVAISDVGKWFKHVEIVSEKRTKYIQRYFWSISAIWMKA